MLNIRQKAAIDLILPTARFELKWVCFIALIYVICFSNELNQTFHVYESRCMCLDRIVSLKTTKT